MKKATIYYHDIGDYLNQKEKLNIIANFKSIINLPLIELNPNELGDWINIRGNTFKDLNKLYDETNESFFLFKSIGIQTINKEVYNSNKNKISKTNKIGNYRPFFKQFFSNDKISIYRPGEWKNFEINKNVYICITGKVGTSDFSILISNNIVDYQFQKNGQCFPLYYYEENTRTQKGIFEEKKEKEYIRRDGVSDWILDKAQKQYNARNISKEDIFYYVYGFLHSPEYKLKYANDLKKMLPRLPLVDGVKDFWAFSKAGRDMAELHLNYESVASYPDVVVFGAEKGNFKVQKMRYPKKDQKDTIIYNGSITISNIPLKAYEYVVNGKSAIDWIMERYQITTHKESGITNNPNDWADEVGNPKYILDLLCSIINVSMQTVDIVNSLPKLNFEEEKKEED